MKMKAQYFENDICIQAERTSPYSSTTINPQLFHSPLRNDNVCNGALKEDELPKNSA